MIFLVPKNVCYHFVTEDLHTTEVGENKPTTTENKTHSSNGQAPSPSSTAPDPPQWAEYTSLRSCILSFPFWVILLWQAILELDATFTLGVLNYFLTRLAKGDTAIGK